MKYFKVFSKLLDALSLISQVLEFSPVLWRAYAVAGFFRLMKTKHGSSATLVLNMGLLFYTLYHSLVHALSFLSPLWLYRLCAKGFQSCGYLSSRVHDLTRQWLSHNSPLLLLRFPRPTCFTNCLTLWKRSPVTIDGQPFRSISWTFVRLS
jgi:hypothetical protein